MATACSTDRQQPALGMDEADRIRQDVNQPAMMFFAGAEGGGGVAQGAPASAPAPAVRMPKGLTRYSSTPDCRPFTLWSSLVASPEHRASKDILQRGSFLIRRQTSTPLMSGNRTSSSTNRENAPAPDADPDDRSRPPAPHNLPHADRLRIIGGCRCCHPPRVLN